VNVIKTYKESIGDLSKAVAYRSVVKYRGRGQSGQAIMRLEKLVLHFIFDTSFILDDGETCRVIQQQF